jgi:CheY-specific phosphatase CheX
MNYSIKLTQSEDMVSQLAKDVAGVVGVAGVAKGQAIINISWMILL